MSSSSSFNSSSSIMSLSFSKFSKPPVLDPGNINYDNNDIEEDVDDEDQEVNEIIPYNIRDGMLPIDDCRSGGQIDMTDIQKEN